MNETTFRNKLQIDVAKKGIKLFRNNVGLLYTKEGTPCRVGLATGSSDLVGWFPVVISQEMVGKKIAVFLCVETKSLKGRKTTEQQRWIDAVNTDGGVALFLSPHQKDEKTINNIEGYIYGRFCGDKQAVVATGK